MLPIASLYRTQGFQPIFNRLTICSRRAGFITFPDCVRGLVRRKVSGDVHMDQSGSSATSAAWHLLRLYAASSFKFWSGARESGNPPDAAPVQGSRSGGSWLVPQREEPRCVAPSQWATTPTTSAGVTFILTRYCLAPRARALFTSSGSL